jgi:hypothetical protein
MHHGYVDRVAIADSVLMDLMTLQQVTCDPYPSTYDTLLTLRSATYSSALSPASSAASPSSSWSRVRAWCRLMPAWITLGATTSWRCGMFRGLVQCTAESFDSGVSVFLFSGRVLSLQFVRSCCIGRESGASSASDCPCLAHQLRRVFHCWGSAVVPGRPRLHVAVPKDLTSYERPFRCSFFGF